MNKLTISVIVPVYNVEAYLPMCLDSLLRQEMGGKEYEVILINDGSTDNSRGICQQYVNEHPNFILLDQENQGVAMARNHGLAKAMGEFVVFVDSDDFLADNGLRQIADVIRQNQDVELVRFFSSYGNHVKDNNDTSIDYSGTAEYLLKKGGYPAFIWTYAYRKSFLDKFNIRFERLRFSEDGLFIATVYLHNPKVVSTRANIYRYVLRQDSAVGNRAKKQSRACVEDGLTAYECINKEMRKSQFRDNRDVVMACKHSMNIKKNSLYSRILSAEYNRREYGNLKRRIVGNGFYPIVPWSADKGNRRMCKLINLIFSSFFTYKMVSVFFTRIFTPYVLPKYRRRVWANG